MIKPILIKVKRCNICIGDVTKKNNKLYDPPMNKRGCRYLTKDEPIDYIADIILVDMKQTFKKGDKLTHLVVNEVHTVKEDRGSMIVTTYDIPEFQSKGEDWSGKELGYFKEQIIAHSSKVENYGNNIPRLSEQAIELLVDYYNEHGQMPESVNLLKNQHSQEIVDLVINLKENITKRLYTEEEVKSFGMFLGNNLKKNENRTIEELFTEWFEN
jgi:hypothetical protein